MTFLLTLSPFPPMKGPAGLTTGVLRGRQACGGRRAQNYVVWTRPSSQGSHRWGRARGLRRPRAGWAGLVGFRESGWNEKGRGHTGTEAVPDMLFWRELASTKALSPPWQRCSHCTRLGASIPCRSPGCPRLYHFPCATASGSFLSMKTLQLLCPEHSEGATHLGEKSCPLDGGQMRVQGCWGLRTLQSTQKSTVTYCPSAPLKYVWPL